ncbi:MULTISPECIES: hypothetical protein [Enterococcus]|uniref:Uncharacterized protein n=1 Tax=Enterococcus sulfureus ATCC 49903 TaxID=1140003 RepID=S0PCE8_9ENTE|nr:hypothetical protein [Enterococcus sulfureus]EOT46537.1 hypothetical protein OMY_01686 [Enterococcus sulfureus ATCC 49903]EOT86151.1 hypothetical protein I573_00904 [Enterococcus sulfureus ATCC 49903]
MTRFRPVTLSVVALFVAFALGVQPVAADTIGFQTLEVGTILDIGRDILSTVTINYNLIYGVGATLNGILFLLIALVLPRKTTPVVDVQSDPLAALPKKRNPKKQSTFPWKKCFTLVGLVLLVIGISLISLAALA